MFRTIRSNNRFLVKEDGYEHTILPCLIYINYADTIQLHNVRNISSYTTVNIHKLLFRLHFLFDADFRQLLYLAKPLLLLFFPS